MVGRILAFVYGTVCYVCFLGVFLYAMGWMGNVLVPKSVDSGPEGPLGLALLVNLALLGLFGLQHSIMARPTFKRWWVRFVPWPIERSTYVLFSNLILILLFWQWRPIGTVLWDVQNPAGRAVLWGLFVVGWLSIPAVSFFINHFDLFGMRQVWLYLRGREYTRLRFGTPGPYRFVRHPLYVGWLLAFWCTPTMTFGHLVFSITTTAYILVAIQLEERNLAEIHRAYEDYRGQVPMLIPRPTARYREESKPAVQPGQ